VPRPHLHAEFGRTPILAANSKRCLPSSIRQQNHFKGVIDSERSPILSVRVHARKCLTITEQHVHRMTDFVEPLHHGRLVPWIWSSEVEKSRRVGIGHVDAPSAADQHLRVFGQPVSCSDSYPEAATTLEYTNAHS
jgi:hypothetical protein